MKLGIKAYKTNCLIYAEGEGAEQLAIEYNADICEGYSTDVFCEKCREDIVDQFPEAENIDDVLMTIRICCDPWCSDVWYVVERLDNDGNVFDETFRYEEDAVKRAACDWDCFTVSEKKRVVSLRVLKVKGNNPVVDYIDGCEVVKEWK